MLSVNSKYWQTDAIIHRIAIVEAGEAVAYGNSDPSTPLPYTHTHTFQAPRSQSWSLATLPLSAPGSNQTSFDATYVSWRGRKADGASLNDP